MRLELPAFPPSIGRNQLTLNPWENTNASRKARAAFRTAEPIAAGCEHPQRREQLFLFEPLAVNARGPTGMCCVAEGPLGVRHPTEMTRIALGRTPLLGLPLLLLRTLERRGLVHTTHTNVHRVHHI